MIGQVLFRSSLLVLFYIYSIFAAPLAAEDNSMMEENMTSSCFKDTLPGQLQLHYDMCMGNNLSGGENMMKENEILSCILKSAGVVAEEALDISKLKTSAAEDEALDMKAIEDSSTFIMSVAKCEADEAMKMADDFVQCLFEALSMNCTNPMISDENSASEEAAEEK